MKDLLIEIGSEEIPARFVPRGLDILKSAFTGFLDSSLISYEKVSAYATPRRLAIGIKGIAEKQDDRTVETVGPPKSAAFDSEGNPTKAASGFARSLKIDVTELSIINTERGEYVAAVIEEKGRQTRDLLTKALPGIISTLNLPKSMRWGNSDIRYFRPIQWILALYGEETLSFELDGIQSNSTSRGHRFLSPAPVEIKDIASYASILKANSVIADITERKNVISSGLDSIESDLNCIIRRDEELIDTVTNLVEYPVMVTGRFNDKYLTLPKELLITVMKVHQKYFSTENPEGNMMPYFVVTSNTSSNNNDTVSKGAAKVLRARLDDAMFYYIEDQKIPFIEYSEKLKKVTFQEKLGTVFQKTERMSSLCSFIADRLELSSKEKLEKACLLCKADLVTGVVGEFPELQGLMGMTYALNSGEDKETAVAIYEHYLPKFPGDELPSGGTGTAVALADRIDNIAAFFFLGLIPTGSEDPYALRRQASGILNILQERDYNILLAELIGKALDNFDVPTERKASLSDSILQFFYQRLEGIFSAQGYRYDLINSVFASKESNLKKLKEKISILSELRKSPEFNKLLIAAKRVYNILVKAAPGTPDTLMFTEESEKDLFNTAEKIKGRVEAGEPTAVFGLEGPINTFFDKILVMDKNEKIKNNRVALLGYVKDIFNSIGDFSEIVEQEN